MSETKVPIKDPPKETPQTEPKVITKVKKVEVEKKLTDDEMVVSKRGFTEMQKSLLDLQKEAETAKTEKAELEKSNLLTQLIAINPKFAELHKDSNKDMLVGALATAKAEANSFTELNKGKDKDKGKPDHNNFTNLVYDWTKHKNTEGLDPWSYS